jgi:hypothetical protein
MSKIAEGDNSWKRVLPDITKYLSLYSSAANLSEFSVIAKQLSRIN